MMKNKEWNKIDHPILFQILDDSISEINEAIVMYKKSGHLDSPDFCWQEEVAYEIKSIAETKAYNLSDIKLLAICNEDISLFTASFDPDWELNEPMDKLSPKWCVMDNFYNVLMDEMMNYLSYEKTE